MTAGEKAALAVIALAYLCALAWCITEAVLTGCSHGCVLGQAAVPRIVPAGVGAHCRLVLRRSLAALARDSCQLPSSYLLPGRAKA